jgi:LPS-assembly lipoprotein
MTQPKARPHIAAALMGAMILGGGLVLSGCGMTPVYGEKSLITRLSQVEIETQEGRIGYFVRQNLMSALGDNSSKAYDLKIDIDEKRYEIGQSNVGTATRFEISSNVTYVLTERGTGKQLNKTNFTSTVTYDSTDSSYAAIAAQKDGQERAATAISKTIESNLVLYFNSQKP